MKNPELQILLYLSLIHIAIAHDLINGVDFLLEGAVLDVVSDASTETVLYADMPIKVQMKVTYTAVSYTHLVI